MGTDRKIIKAIGWFLFYWVWQFPQTLCGAVLYLVLWPWREKTTYRSVGRKIKETDDKVVVLYPWIYENPFVNISLGWFVFVQSEYTAKHELGHQRQSWILGPLYLLVIGLPALLWCWILWAEWKRWYRGNYCMKIPYDWLYTEAWANWLARRL